MSDSSEDEYEVEAIIDHRYSGTRRQYLVKWAGYDSSNNTWEPVKNLESAKDLIDQYQDENLDPFDIGVSDSKAAKDSSSKQKSTKQSTDKQAKGSNASNVISIGSDDDDDNDDEDDDDDDDNDNDNEKPLSDTTPKKRVLRYIKKDMNDSDSELDWGQNKKRRLRSSAQKPASTYNTNVNLDDIDDDSESGSESDTDKKGAGMAKENSWNRILLEVENDDQQEALSVIDDPKYPPSNTHWENRVNKVVGVFHDIDPPVKRGILLWKDNNYSVHDLEKLHKKCPIALLRFYESHITFKGDHKVNEK